MSMLDYDYKYVLQIQTTFIVASSDPIWDLSGFGPNPYESLQLIGIRPVCFYVTVAGGRMYIPSLWIGLSSPGLVRNNRQDYSTSAPTPGGTTIVQNPGLNFTIDSKLMGQPILCDGVQGSQCWQNILIQMVNQFGAGGGTTVPNGGTAYSIGDICTIEIDFFFKRV